MARLPAAIRGRSTERTAEQSSADDDRSGLGSALRKALLGLGILALAYVVARRMGAGPMPAQSPDEVRESAPVGSPGARRGGPVGSSTREEPSTELPGVDRSAEEIEERAEADVQETPAEPGEMTVDEEVVEDIVDEAEEGAEAGAGEETETDEGSEANAGDEDRA